jgi:hypothetical protein
MLIEKLIAADAIERIASATGCGGRVLGVDGFHVVPKGFIAALDLILDLSTRSMTPEQAAGEATRFISLHAAADVVFEVVFADDGMGSYHHSTT